ncbi:hypothetical protein ACFXHA_20110 [Nocardia sp. NPDC059240]|uniref:hypothetical protein n=1 Tax=Nocardia sp. NPDC059240 TaxID=3346786 RepID=UPI00367BA090
MNGTIGEPAGEAGTLAHQQAALVRALVAGDAVPAGFDAEDLAATTHGLLHKRAEEVRRRFPQLAHAAGTDFVGRYVEWARTRPKTSTPEDAAAFAGELGLPDPRPAGRARLRWPTRRR